MMIDFDSNPFVHWATRKRAESASTRSPESVGLRSGGQVVWPSYGIPVVVCQTGNTIPMQFIIIMHYCLWQLSVYSPLAKLVLSATRTYSLEQTRDLSRWTNDACDWSAKPNHHPSRSQRKLKNIRSEWIILDQCQRCWHWQSCLPWTRSHCCASTGQRGECHYLWRQSRQANQTGQVTGKHEHSLRSNPSIVIECCHQSTSRISNTAQKHQLEHASKWTDQYEPK